jgi:anaerobic selenocysteine-containing dehydrogenase
MTNHWADIDNTSLVFVMGANPSENHPACMGHVNAARYDTLGRGRTARMVVIDPRKTRTACLADLYVRIRPGTDIAFLNAMLNYILTGVDAGTLNSTFSTNLKAWHNGLNANHVSAARTFVDDSGVTRTLSSAELLGAKFGGVASLGFSTVTTPAAAAGWPKYCDSRALVDTAAGGGTYVDYQRGVLTTKSYNTANSTTDWQFSNMPVFVKTVDSSPNTVWNKLKAHVANYTLDEAADICGCTAAEISACADELIANSRMMSTDFADATSSPATAGYKAATILYAMGQTQHTYGSQNIRDLAVLQTLLGNMGRAGGGINALRGIHNVQGSTDFANLYDGIPGYSNNPGSPASATSYDAYVDGLFGNRTLSTATGAGDRYEPRKLGLQQRGFYNMTTQFFGQTGSTFANVANYVVEGAKAAPLANFSVNMGTVVVSSGPGPSGTIYRDGVDYTVGYGSATILGSISRVAYKVAPSIPEGGTVYVNYTYGSPATTAAEETITFGASAATAKSTFTLPKVPNASPAIVVKPSVGGTPFTVTTDYTVNYATGVVTWVDGGAITYGSTVYVSYETGAGPTVVTDQANAFAKGSVTLKDTWLKSGTLTLTTGTDGALVLGTDYTIDYQAGVVTRLHTPAITDTTTFKATYDKWTKRAADSEFEAFYGLWPKGNGVDHITAFRAMGSGYARADAIKAAVIWGQNPAVTEPNQSFVRAGLENLDLLVVTDIFETETAACKRKADGVTYLLPACSHVEEAGSVTNSGRWLQWRDRARGPHGNSKSDLELLLRFSKALATAGAFTRIKTEWTDHVPSIAAGADVWDVLFGKYCDTWDGVTSTAGSGFEDLTFNDVDRGYGTVYGSEAVAETIFKEICRPLDDSSVGAGGGGVMWIYSGAGSASAYNAIQTNVSPTIVGYDGTVAGGGWATVNRAKSRDSSFAGVARNFPRYGWSWLLNRRVFYNNSEVVNDVADVFVAPGVIARLMTFDYKNPNTKANWSLLYRAYNYVKDVPSRTGVGTPHELGLPGNFPAFTEPIETPRRDLAAKYGRNTVLLHAAGDTGPLVKADSKVALWSSTDPAYADDATYGSAAAPHNAGSWDVDAKDYPLVLTTIRCVEHFQGGPITRNNSWNVEAEPVPWIEINSVDARACNPPINDGDWVNVTTARGNSHLSQEAITNNTPANWALGFRARVGVGLLSNQRVAPGVVAIPWHWGDKGLSTGSRANDLCIDAFDANTAIPEYKACLCKIAKM